MLRSLPHLLVLGSAILVGGLGSALAQSPDGEGRERPPRVRNATPKQQQERGKKEEQEGYKQMSEVAPLLAYRIKFVDIPLVAEEMQLDKGQQEILEQIIVDYMQQLDQERLQLLDRMIRSKEASHEGCPFLGGTREAASRGVLAKRSPIPCPEGLQHESVHAGRTCRFGGDRAAGFESLGDAQCMGFDAPGRVGNADE